MPIFRITSPTGVPVSACRNAKAICSSLYRVFFMAKPSLSRSRFCRKLTLILDQKIEVPSKEHGLTIVRRRSCRGKSTTLSHLAVTVFGNCKFSAPVVLLLHGSRSSSHMFRNLIPLLADKNQRGRRTTVRAIRLSLRDLSAQKALFAI